MNKRLFQTFAAGLILACVIIYGCITRYDPPGVKSFTKLLVVEGIITDSITTIRLSRSVALSESLNYALVNDGEVYVECDDGSVSEVSLFAGNGAYKIRTGKLNPDRQYRIKVNLDGETYRSEFLTPLMTPDFELSWVQRANRALVSIQVSTQDTLKQSAYYLWSYLEDWEFTARLWVDSFCVNFEWVPHDISAPGNRYYCWKKDSSRIFILGNAERMIGNEIKDREIMSFFASSERVSLLYHIAVKQHLIRKEAYAYYANLQKNIEQAGSIFTPIPAEIPGNLYCVTSPDLPVIGYVEVSTTVVQKKFIEAKDVYIGTAYDVENIKEDCYYYNKKGFFQPPPECYNTVSIQWAVINPSVWFLSRIRIDYNPICVDCIKAGGTKDKPEWWPTDHL